MDSPPPTSSVSAVPAPALTAAPAGPLRRPPDWLVSWPRSAQLAAAFLLGLATALLVVNAYGLSRWGSKPTTLDRGAYRIDLNRADRAELLQLPGIGESLAGRIEDYRQQHGPFRSVDELTRVRGIGPAAMSRLRDWVCVTANEIQDDERPVIPASADMGRPARKQQAVSSAASPRSLSKKAASLTEPIDVNKAAAIELQRLPGVGPKMAQRIVDERSKGPFKSVEELRRVSGIGPKTLENLRPYVTVGSETIRLAATD